MLGFYLIIDEIKYYAYERITINDDCSRLIVNRKNSALIENSNFFGNLTKAEIEYIFIKLDELMSKNTKYRIDHKTKNLIKNNRKKQKTNLVDKIKRAAQYLCSKIKMDKSNG